VELPGTRKRAGRPSTWPARCRGCYHAAMAIRKIAQLGHPILRRKAAPLDPDQIGSSRVQELIDDMIETMRDADGAGIAAPQVYEGTRICVIEVSQNPRYPAFPAIPLMILVNPILEMSAVSAGALSDADSITMYEGCLSVPGLRGKVRRPRRVRVRALDRDGAPLAFDWEGVAAAIVQHEVDHLDGMLFVDRADPKTLAFQREYERFVPLETRVTDCG
jgi:peptide deformylase